MVLNPLIGCVTCGLVAKNGQGNAGSNGPQVASCVFAQGYPVIHTSRCDTPQHPQSGLSKNGVAQKLVVSLLIMVIIGIVSRHRYHYLWTTAYGNSKASKDSYHGPDPWLWHGYIQDPQVTGGWLAHGYGPPRNTILVRLKPNDKPAANFKSSHLQSPCRAESSFKENRCPNQGSKVATTR